MSWRTEARAALRQYPRCKRKQAETAEMRITPNYGGVAVQRSASRTTENVALSSTLTDEESNIISAVEFMLHMQSHYYNYEARRKMIEVVYFSNNPKRYLRSLEYAAEVVEYGERTVKNWNNEILTAVYVGLKKSVPVNREKPDVE